MLSTKFVSEAVCELEGLSVAGFAALNHCAYVLDANKWNKSAGTCLL